WAKAARVTLDIYGSNVHCASGGGVTGADAPQFSRSFAARAAVALDMAPGHHAVVLTLFADDAATVPLAAGCTERDFVGGSNACLTLTLDSLDPPACSSDGDCAGASSPDGGGTMACCANHCVDLAVGNLRSCGGSVCVAATTCCGDADCTAPPGRAGCYL